MNDKIVAAFATIALALGLVVAPVGAATAAPVEAPIVQSWSVAELPYVAGSAAGDCPDDYFCMFTQDWLWGGRWMSRTSGGHSFDGHWINNNAQSWVNNTGREWAMLGGKDCNWGFVRYARPYGWDYVMTGTERNAISCVWRIG
jgi:hypothetical protein